MGCELKGVGWNRRTPPAPGRGGEEVGKREEKEKKESKEGEKEKSYPNQPAKWWRLGG